MRNILILLFLTTFQVFADNAYSQITTISLDLDQSTIKSVLQEIEKNSEFFFLYNSKLVDDVQKVDAQFEDEKIDEILAQVFKGSNIDYIVMDRQIILSPKKYLSEIKKILQPIIITGTVTDEDGNPIPGVNIMIKGTTQGTITDLEGNYSLEVPGGESVLVFSSVGFEKKEAIVGNQTVIDLDLSPDITALEEIIVVGYGSMKKTDLTGSIISADIEAFKESPNVSVLQSLQGSVPGLNVGQVNLAGEDPSLLIRGHNTFSSENNAPLIVLDGIIYHGNLVDINPADIESVDVLKDASSAAVYGARSANGVIIITTKKGEAYGKPIFSYSGHYTIQNPSNVPEILDREGYLNKLRDAKWEDGYLAPNYTEPNPDFDPTNYWTRDELIEGFESGTEFDWWDAATQTGHIQEHNLSMRGRSDLTSYFISTGFTDQLGYIENDKYKRYSVRMNVENKIFDWLKLGVQSFISSSDYSGQIPRMDHLITQSPMVTPYDEEGNLQPNPDGGPAENPFFRSSADDYDKRMNLFGNFYADINIPFIKGLSYRLNYSHNYLANRNYYFSQYESNFKGNSYKFNSTLYNWTFDNILTYSRTIKEHGINLTLVAGREEREYESTTAEASEFAKMDLIYNNLAVGGIPLNSSGAWDESSLYYMGRFHYDYSNKYLATFTIRRDGFSGFSEKDKFGIFPSGAVAWVVSEENFMKDNQGFLNLLKIRASYGENGNRTLGRYGTLSRVEAQPGYVFGDGSSPFIVQRIERLGNSNLIWETTTAINLGVDFAFWNQRIRGNVEYYNSNTENILFQVSIPEISGYNSIPDNIGKVHNNGMELTIIGTIIQKGDFTWDMTMNLWRNRNEIVSIIGLDDDNDGIEDDLIADGLFIGEPLGVVYNFVTDGGLYQIGDDDIPDGFRPGQHRFKDLNNDGVITADFDREITGYTDPSYQFSINNHFKYKNWSLRIFISSMQGGDMMYYGQNYPNNNYGENATYNNSFNWDWWSPSNPDAEYPQLYYKTPVSPTYSVYRQRSFIRLQDVSLSYTFDKSLINKIGFRDLKIYLSGKNLFTWTKWNGWDPETGQGLIRNGSPVLRGYTFGMDFSF